MSLSTGERGSRRKGFPYSDLRVLTGLGDRYVSVTAILQGDRIHEDVALNVGAVEDIVRPDARPVHSDATDFDASPKRSKPSQQLAGDGMMRALRLGKLGT